MKDDHEQLTDAVPEELFKRVSDFIANARHFLEDDPKGEEKVTFEVIRMSIHDERERVMEYLMDYRGWLMAKKKTYKRNTKEHGVISGAICMLNFMQTFVEKGVITKGGMFDDEA